MSAVTLIADKRGRNLIVRYVPRTDLPGEVRPRLGSPGVTAADTLTDTFQALLIGCLTRAIIALISKNYF
jgi:hypothetical protein